MTCAALVPFTPLQRDIVSESYEDLQRMVYRIVLLFQGKYGGDFDTLISEANRIFLLAHARHDENKGKLTTHIYHAVYRGLRDVRRRERRRLHGNKEMSLDAITEKKEDETNVQIEAVAAKFQSTTDDIYMLLSGVGDDCRNIVNLLLFPPADLCDEINEFNDPDEWKTCLEEYLRFRLKWARERIRQSFKELESALSE